MAESLKDFIIRRRTELDAEEKPLRDQLAAIKAERDQLHRAALAVGIEVVAAPEPPGETPAARRSIPEKTIKEAALEILKANPEGMTANQILEHINHMFAVSYPRSSLSPQLSRLKADEKIVLQGKVWILKDYFDLFGGLPDHSLFEEERSGSSDADPEAYGVEAAPGGGT